MDAVDVVDVVDAVDAVDAVVAVMEIIRWLPVHHGDPARTSPRMQNVASRLPLQLKMINRV